MMMEREIRNKYGHHWLIVLAVLALGLAACGDDAGSTTTVAPADDATTTAPLADATTTEAPDDGTATTGDDGGEPMVDLTGVEYIPSTSQASALLIPQFYAFDLLTEWGASVEPVTLTNIPGVQALVAGQTNLAPHGADELILGAAEGATPVGVGSLVAKQEYVLVAGGDITTVADLAGATIGMSGPAGFDALLTRFVLEDEGIDPESGVSFVQVGGSPDRAAALLSGNVDAATIGVDDWFQLASQTDEAQIVVRLAETVPDYPSSVYFGLADFWAENPDAALGIACANLEANQWAQEDRQRFIDYGLELIEGADGEAIGELYDFAIEVGMYPTDPAEVLSTRGMQGLMEAMVETGDISQPIDVEAVVDTSYLEEAAAMGCGQ
jgi:NitT/TauT family transport system substrate-binding protein